MVDVFIPNKKSKSGKRFVFVGFIMVRNLERLIENLNTIWIGRVHLIANPAHYDRPNAPLKQNGYTPVPKHNVEAEYKVSKGNAMVLDDSCAMERDWSNNFMGQAKDITSISNLKSLIKDEVMDIEDNVDYSFGRKRICIKTKQHLSILEAFKVIFKGKVFSVRAKELFTWTPVISVQKEGEDVLDDEVEVESKHDYGRPQDSREVFSNGNVSDDEVVSDTVFGDNSPIPPNHSAETGKPQSEDPFRIYDILNKQPRAEPQEVNSPLSHPPGFTPVVQPNDEVPVKVNANVMNNSQDASKGDSGFMDGSNVVRTGRSVLGVMEDLIRVGKAMGEANGYSGGIIYVWESTVFKKENATISDNFVAVYGTWLPTNSKIRFVAVYAPQRLTCLVDVKIKGYEFTWIHPSGSKMSKLDRFLVSEGIYFVFPSITDMCLDKHLSDHRPIVLRETWSFLVASEIAWDCQAEGCGGRLLAGNMGEKMYSVLRFKRIIKVLGKNGKNGPCVNLGLPCEANGYSGGIIYVWESTVYKKENATISDNFVAVYGTWLPTNFKILFVAIYAPQRLTCKRLLWDYVSTLIDR
nr:RNA-directed DNA polymerase, eukaryota [Tanacetum cinerariifolium]